jgi:uroporphyrin-III C-methyltransferase
MSSVGKVFLVGGGPGHPELMTLKAVGLLRRADAIVFDRLVQEEVLDLCRPEAERIYVGKRPGCHESRQFQINATLVELAQRHQVVVRLKGGDPLVFGRGGEEAEALAQAGVPFEVIPGVSSALAAPAAAGIPVTHRDLACSFAVVTGHEKEGAGDGRIDWGALARIDTVVVLMGVHALERISERLIAGGRDPATPAALVQTAFWAEERVVTATLATIAAAAKREQVKAPATLVVGETVRLHERLGLGHRELRRLCTDTQPAPGPSTGELQRFVGSIRDARRLQAALKLRLFDHLTTPVAPAEAARRAGLDGALVADLCEGLVRVRVLAAKDGRVQCCEAAARYLVSSAPGYLGERIASDLEEALAFDPLATATPAGNGRRAVLAAPAVPVASV